MLENADAEDEGEEKLVFLEQRATDVLVDAVREVLVQVGDALLQVVRLLRVQNALCMMKNPAYERTYSCVHASGRHPAYAHTFKRDVKNSRTGVTSSMHTLTYKRGVKHTHSHTSVMT